MRPASQQAWAQKGERGSPALIRFIAWLAQKAGRGPTRLLLHPISLYFVLFAPSARRHVRNFLHRAYGHPPRIPDIYRHFHSFASTLLDRVFFLTDRFALFDLSFEGWDDLEAARAEGRGVILLGAHFGCFDTMRALAMAHDAMPLKVLMHSGPDSRIAQAIHALNPTVAETIIPLGGTESVLQVNEWLKQGGMVGILGDRITHGDKVRPVRFMGDDVHLPVGPWVLASLTGAPVVMFAGMYLGENRYVIRFTRLCDRVPRIRGRETTATAFAPFMQVYADTLEEWAEEAPHNWFNFYDFWS